MGLNAILHAAMNPNREKENYTIKHAYRSHL